MFLCPPQIQQTLVMHPVHLPAHWPNVRRMIKRERAEGGRKGGREREGEGERGREREGGREKEREGGREREGEGR